MNQPGTLSFNQNELNQQLTRQMQLNAEASGTGYIQNSSEPNMAYGGYENGTFHNPLLTQNERPDLEE